MVKKNDLKSEDYHHDKSVNFTLIENLMLNEGIHYNINERSHTNNDYWERKGTSSHNITRFDSNNSKSRERLTSVKNSEQ